MSTASNGKPKTVRLALLRGPAAEVELPNGREIHVMPAHADAVELYRELHAVAQQGAPQEERHWDELRHMMPLLLPQATAEELGQLTPEMMAVVLTLSMGQVDAVQAVLERGRSTPGAAKRAPKSSRRRTTSNTS